VVRREGEETAVDLLNELTKAYSNSALQTIQGISYYSDGKYLSTPDRPFIEDLDALPFPARHLAPMQLYEHPGIIVTGRGCPFHCQFCVAGPLSGHNYRVRSPENVIEEVEECHSAYNITDFYFADDTLTAVQERARVLFDLLDNLDFSIRWICESRATAVTPELLKKMAHSGCIKIQFGVESGSDHVLRSINKGITTDRVRKAVMWALDAGLDVKCSFIIGHPQDAVETIQQTIQLGRELTQLGAECAYSISTPLPGTDLWNRAEELGVRILTHDYDYYDFMSIIMETKTLNKHQLSSFMLEAKLPFLKEVDS
jgi:anaerobic magnesium-protoporphyrin IX monomethyl ester cyclase